MATGNFWDVTNAKKPFGEFDPNGIYDIPFDWATWLTGLGETYASHTITCATGLTCATSAQNAGVVVARIKKTVGATLTEGDKIAVTCHIVTTNGQEEDQTLYLKVREK